MKEKISAIFTDLDGTLLDEQAEVAPITLDALERAEKDSIPVVLCTGRAYAGVWAHLWDLPGVEYAICGNGALMYGRGQDGKPCNVPLHNVEMGHARARALFDAVGDLDLSFDVMADEHIYAQKDRFSRMAAYDVAPHIYAQLMRSRTLLEDDADVYLDRLGRVDRVSIYYADPAVRTACIKAIEKVGGLGWTTSEAHNLEVADARASKGAAIQWLCKNCDIDIARTVAFGDAPNDIPMFEAAALGIAMRNAPAEVQNAARAVSLKTNNEGGVGACLVQLLG